MPMRPQCYGEMLPDLDELDFNKPCAGKALTCQVNSQLIGVQSREVRVNVDEWAKCEACPEFRSCYDLSMAVFVLKEAIAVRF